MIWSLEVSSSPSLSAVAAQAKEGSPVRCKPGFVLGQHEMRWTEIVMVVGVARNPKGEGYLAAQLHHHHYQGEEISRSRVGRYVVASQIAGGVKLMVHAGSLRQNHLRLTRHRCVSWTRSKHGFDGVYVAFRSLGDHMQRLSTTPAPLEMTNTRMLARAISQSRQAFAEFPGCTRPRRTCP